jgi:hypothetical protein
MIINKKGTDAGRAGPRRNRNARFAAELPPSTREQALRSVLLVPNPHPEVGQPIQRDEHQRLPKGQIFLGAGYESRVRRFEKAYIATAVIRDHRGSTSSIASIKQRQMGYARLLRRSRRLDRASLTVDRVLRAIRNGSALHLMRGQTDSQWFLSNGLRLTDKVARIVKVNQNIVAFDLALFRGMRGQT